jgi:hypothetical protein
VLTITAPGAGQYRSAANWLGARVQPGDAVVVTPRWNLDRLRFFEGLGIPVLAGSDGDAALAAGFRRVWVIFRAGWPRPPGPPAVETQAVDGLRLELVQRASGSGPERRSIALDLFSRARAVVRDQAGTRTPCSREAWRLRCGPADWQWVGPHVLRVQGVERDCLWAHPISRKTISIELPGVPLRGNLALTTLLSEQATARKAGAPIEVVVRVAGRPIARFQHGFSTPVLRQEIRTPPGPADVQLDISVEHDGMSHFCLDLEL